MKITSENKPLADLLTVAGQVAQLVTCTACKAKNRITHKQLELGRKPRCGRCGLPLEQWKDKR